jgi:ATP-dependent helicase/nuclease subunit A
MLQLDFPFNHSNDVQKQASSPSTSVYLNASAGTGKTKVLVDRFLRLLLTGTPISNILCITFTNLAANEMVERISTKLKVWSNLKTHELANELINLTGNTPSEQNINLAKSLYNDFITSENSIKIQTVHSFCNNVLNKYVDSNKPRPKLAEPNVIDQLLKETIYKIFLDHENDQLSEYIDNLSSFYDFNNLFEIIKTLMNKRNQLIIFKEIITQHDIDAFYKTFFHIENENIEDIKAKTFNLNPHFITALAQLNHANEKIFYKLSSAIEKKSYTDYLECFFNKDGSIKAALCSKKFSESNPNIKVELLKEAERLNEIKNEINSLILYKFNASLFHLIFRVLEEFEILKATERLFEYDDLIFQTIELLTSSESALSILFNLDYQIDHILVDEAQDLSPLQWKIIKIISDEFFSGASSRNLNRTLFIVGDYKQSIYSFQGADPKAFIEIKDYFSDKIQNSGNEWLEIDMNTSFRSTSPVLNLIDNIFNKEEFNKAISYKEAKIEHIPFRLGNGTVEIWPLIDKNEKIKLDSWKFPETKFNLSDNKFILANEIVSKIYSWIKDERLLTGHNRPIQAKDIMILVRKRSELTMHLSSLLKNYNIKVYDLDKKFLSEELAVKDLLSLLTFITTPYDDFNLACLMKSPIFNITEEELFNLAYNRSDASLFERSAQLPEIYNYLTNVLDLAASASKPSEIIFTLLELDNMRTNFSRRFGPEINIVLDEFLNALLKYESENIPNIIDFLHWFQESQIQYSLPATNDGVRILTSHAAKGLQAPIVILADAASSEQSPHENIFWHHNVPFFLPYADLETESIKSLKENNSKYRYNENLRLLYVALTRAEDEIYIAGIKNNKAEKSWYSIIQKHLCL